MMGPAVCRGKDTTLKTTLELCVMRVPGLINVGNSFAKGRNT